MILTKVTTKKYEVKFFPGSWDMKHGKFISTRKRMGMKTAPYEKCFVCGYKFTDDEVPVFITVSNGIGNRFACAQCAEREENHVK